MKRETSAPTTASGTASRIVNGWMNDSNCVKRGEAAENNCDEDENRDGDETNSEDALLKLEVSFRPVP